MAIIQTAKKKYRESKASQNRVLVVHDQVSTLRLIRETLENFTYSEVDTSPNAEYGFELALQRNYKLFIFYLSMPVLPGELLYNMISKAYVHCHSGTRAAPAVIYLANEKDGNRIETLLRDARVKGVILRPINIRNLLEKVGTVIPVKKEGGAE